MSGIGSPDIGSPVEIPESTPAPVEQDSSTTEAARVEHTALPENAPAQDPDATVIEDQSPYDDTVLEDHLSPEEVANIQKARADLRSANSDPTFIEDQSTEPQATTTEAQGDKTSFTGKGDFYVDLAKPTFLERIRTAASKVASKVLPRR